MVLRLAALLLRLAGAHDLEGNALLQTSSGSQHGLLERGSLVQKDVRRKVYFKRDWHHGFNNLRYELESLIAFCAVYDRVLVLPPPSAFSHVKIKYTEDLIWDMENLGKAITYELSGVDPQDMKKIDDVFVFEGSVGDAIKGYDGLPKDKDWFITKTQLQQFDCLPFAPEQQKVASTAVFNALRFKPEYQKRAMDNLAALGLESGDFVSLHLRRGDFIGLRDDWMSPAETIADSLDSFQGLIEIPGLPHERMSPLMLSSVMSMILDVGGGNLPILMATDALDDDPFLADLARSLPGRELHNTRSLYKDETPLARISLDISMLAHGRQFVGSPGSTFSHGIDELRQILHRGDQGYNMTYASYDANVDAKLPKQGTSRGACINTCCSATLFRGLFEDQ